VSRVPAIVQFPHPGPEHVPKGDWMPWNTATNHRRKFMISRGTLLDSEGYKDETDVVFWGEWEPPSHVVHRWPTARGLPTVLHRPCVSEPPLGPRQNTDPWVFGDAFLYSNCKQLNARPRRSPSALQRLDHGSIILFGSASYGRFVLDTLLVVGEVVGSFTPLDSGMDFDPTFQLCTVDSLTTDDTATASLTLFRGATPENPIESMFSFVPCMEATDTRQRFERPAIHLPGVINPTSKQSPSGAKVARSLAARQEAWAAVVDQVQAAGLSLAAKLALPGRS
jgi:hypothetical protein